MISESAWRSILTAPSSSEAVEIASNFPISCIHQSRIPWLYQELSYAAKANIRAVSRALDVTIEGVPSDGWVVWALTPEDAKLPYGWEDKPLDADPAICMLTKTTNEAEENVSQDNTTPVTAVVPAVAAAARESLIKSTKVTKNRSESAPGVDDLTAKNTDGAQDPKREPSALEIQSAETIRNWALQSPHTLPPAEAVETLRKSVIASKLLVKIVSPEDPSTLRATMINTFSEDIGSTFACQLMKTLIIPYVTSLKAPASREMLQAVVRFAELHWRTAVSMYESAGDELGVNGAMAEVLVRVAGVIGTAGAMQSLRAFCSSKWGEDGIRVIEALVCKCKDERDAAGIVVSSMERNVLGLESSVRFGKLLFTVVRDVSGIIENYEQEMESIIGRSKVFLANRALSMLKEKRRQSSAE